MDRLTKKFESLKRLNQKALVTFISAGDPDLKVTADAIQALEESGADIIELGMPFSDPMADGPTIQLSSERALASGTTLAGILDVVRNIRISSEIPIILMGYLNPVHAYGYEKFARDAAQAGVDGVLLVDMPPEESELFLGFATAHGLNMIFLLTPTSDEDRIDLVVGLGKGFLYYVTVTGVTGERQDIAAGLEEQLNRIRNKIKLPIVAGFGISTPKQAADVATLADGVVVGSAIVKLFQQHSGQKLISEIKGFVSALKLAISPGPN